MPNDSPADPASDGAKEAQAYARKQAWEANERLAKRAETRRLELGISQVNVASMCSVTAATLGQWENRLPKKPRPQEPSWEAALGVPAGWLRNPAVATPALQFYPTNQAAQGTEVPIRKLSAAERENLGARAKNRRNELSMSREYLAGKVGTNSANLVLWERQLPIKRRSAEENWEATLQVPTGWLRDIGIEIEASQTHSAVALPENTTVAGEIRNISSWVTRGPILSRTFEREGLSPLELLRSDIFARRYGVLGEEDSKLQSIGEEFKLTRERIRQITAKMAERVSGFAFHTPRFDELISLMPESLPSRVADLDTRFRSLLGESLSIVSADRFAREILGKAVTVITDRPADMALPWDKVAIDPNEHDSAALRAVRDAARAMIRSAGAAQLFFVAGAAAKILGRGIDIEKVLRCCKVISGFEWLIETDGWFWFGLDEGNNRLLRIALKILAISNRSVDGEEIHAALVRSRRDHYDSAPGRPYLIEPTIDVVIEVLRRLPDVATVQSNNFRLKEPIPLKGLLSDAELAIFNCLSANGGVASTATLDRLLVEPGLVKHMTLHICLNSTSIAIPIDFGLYVLRGYSLSPSSLGTEAAARWERLSEAQRFLKREEGVYTYEFELTPYMLQTRFFSVSAPLSSVLTPGEYSVRGAASAANYVVLENGTKRLRQLVNKIAAAGYSEGQRIRLVVEVGKRLISFEDPVAPPVVGEQ